MNPNRDLRLTMTTTDKWHFLKRVLAETTGKGRPSKHYKKIVQYLHDNDYIHKYEGESVYYQLANIQNFINNGHDAGLMNEIFENLWDDYPDFSYMPDYSWTGINPQLN